MTNGATLTQNLKTSVWFVSKTILTAAAAILLIISAVNVLISLSLGNLVSVAIFAPLAVVMLGLIRMLWTWRAPLKA